MRSRGAVKFGVPLHAYDAPEDDLLYPPQSPCASIPPLSSRNTINCSSFVPVDFTCNQLPPSPRAMRTQAMSAMATRSRLATHKTRPPWGRIDGWYSFQTSRNLAKLCLDVGRKGVSSPHNFLAGVDHQHDKNIDQGLFPTSTRYPCGIPTRLWRYRSYIATR